jgi:hypothetical protein
MTGTDLSVLALSDGVPFVVSDAISSLFNASITSSKSSGCAPLSTQEVSYPNSIKFAAARKEGSNTMGI